ncbi:MAG: fosfomycin resistance glutathione transferase [Hyphomicrobiaceae bacterium]|nr:fosfomycin resistance glutathione transferase [Hyphomicrobiaceae bacterium]
MSEDNTPRIKGVNHITLAVSDLDAAVDFYRDVLGLELRKRWPGGAYLEAGDFWICLSPDEATRQSPHSDYTHLAFDVDNDAFEALAARITRAGARVWKDNRSEGRSHYFLDPDGHKLELHVGTLETRLNAMDLCCAP